MGQRYLPCEFRFWLEEVDLDSVRANSIYLLKENRFRIRADVTIDRENEIVFVKPCDSFEELCEYKLIFSEELSFADGRSFSHDYFLRLRVKGGRLYTPQNGPARSDAEFFAAENLLLHGFLLRVCFLEDSAGGGLRFTAEPPETDAPPAVPFQNRTTHGNAASSRKRRTRARLPVLLLLALLLAVFLRACRFYIWLPEKDEDYIPKLPAKSAAASFVGPTNDRAIGDLVMEAGGHAVSRLRATLVWNDGRRNANDYDLICVEPDGTILYFANPGDPSTGIRLDVDEIFPRWKQTAVENIYWDSSRNLPDGVYSFYVCNYSERRGKDGFHAEIVCDGKQYAFAYQEPMEEGETVKLADCVYHEDTGFSLEKR